MLIISTWQDIENAGREGKIPPTVWKHLQKEFLDLHEHLGEGEGRDTFNLNQHGRMTVICPEDAQIPLKKLLRYLPGSEPECVDRQALPDGSDIFRAVWMVDNDCLPITYFLPQWLRNDVRAWLENYIVQWEQDEPAGENVQPF